MLFRILPSVIVIFQLCITRPQRVPGRLTRRCAVPRTPPEHLLTRTCHPQCWPPQPDPSVVCPKIRWQLPIRTSSRPAKTLATLTNFPIRWRDNYARQYVMTRPASRYQKGANFRHPPSGQESSLRQNRERRGARKRGGPQKYPAANGIAQGIAFATRRIRASQPRMLRYLRPRERYFPARS